MQRSLRCTSLFRSSLALRAHNLGYRTMSTATNELTARNAEIQESLAEIRSRVEQAASSSSGTATLVAVSKYKPASDIQACFSAGQLDFGENYVQELEDKAKVLPTEIRWHFIGTLQSNKAKVLADQHLGRGLQVWAPPLEEDADVKSAEATQLARHIITECPRLRLQGLMTIGALEQSLSGDENADFERLKGTRDVLAKALMEEFGSAEKWGEDGRLLLSMGMSSDFEAALKAGSDIVRVGTGIFGARAKK
ncbi:Pyridoxal phosphate homeostasis protein [Mycena venus]|uniref:Pyridoxal phosphate homeostasis protein n=1 Tax=Mycena venus TaxID=2733690 RepID=A0A8H7CI02_9AGAR|nr:Pyridoxal phosphate homeostasis protein [Mycena venus]